MNTSPTEPDLVKDSLLYKEFLAEREEILRHKWLESERAGHDIGFEKALLDWVVRHRADWRARRQQGQLVRGQSMGAMKGVAPHILRGDLSASSRDSSSAA